MDYHKILKKNKEVEKQNKKKKKLLDKLFLRIFLSSLIILLSVLLFKNTNFKEKLNKNFNFLSLTTLINSTLGNFIEIDDKAVYSSSIYDEIYFDGRINKIINNNFNGVYSLTSGVITKIERNKDTGTYNVTVLGSDDYEYIYLGLKEFDLYLYAYVTHETVLGIAEEENDKFKFSLIIRKDGVNFNFYEKCED